MPCICLLVCVNASRRCFTRPQSQRVCRSSRKCPNPILLHVGPASSVAQGELGGQFVLSFKADAENVLVAEAEELVHMVPYPDVLTDMTVSSQRDKAPPGRGGF